MKKLRLGLILIHPPSPTLARLFTLFWSPFAPLCPILRSPVKTSWINANLSLYHGSSMSIENFFGKIQNILSLVVVNDPQMLKSRNNIFFSYTCHLTDITIERKRKKMRIDWNPVWCMVQSNLSYLHLWGLDWIVPIIEIININKPKIYLNNWKRIQVS